MMLARVFQALQRCTKEEWRAGLRFYQDAHQLCVGWGKTFGLEARVVAGVVAALSPNTSWRENKRSARMLLEGKDWGIRSYRRDHIKALWVLAGADPEAVMDEKSAPKTNAFFRLLEKGGDREAVCVDGHMVNLVKGEQRPLKGISLGRVEYQEVAQVVRDMATLINENSDFPVQPCQVQATLWVAWRAGLKVGQGRLEMEGGRG